MALNVVSSAAQGSEPPCTPEKRRHASDHEQSSDSDSGESLFITQSAASKRVTKRKPATPKLATRKQATPKPATPKPASPKPATQKQATQKPATPSRPISDNRSEDKKEKSRAENDFLRKWDILGDFLITPAPRKPKAKAKASPRIRYRPKKALFPFLLKSQRQQYLSLPKHQVLENSEIGGFFKCIKKMHKSAGSPNMLEFVPSDDLEEENSDHEVTVVNKAAFVLKKNKKNEWLTQSILERRGQDPEDENLQNQSETFQVLCSDSELSDSAGSELAHVIRSDDEASDGGHVWLVEETQRLTQALHKDARTNTECTSLFLSQGGDVSTQNHTRHKSRTKANKRARDDLEETLLFAQNSDEDSDVTLIDADRGARVFKSGPEIPREKYKSNADGKIAQRLSQSISTSPKTHASMVTGEQEEQQLSESQDASQSVLDSHAKLVPEEEIKSPKKKKRLSRKDVEVQDTVIDPASGPVCNPAIEMEGSPLFKHVGLGFIKRKRKEKKTDKGSDEIQCETNMAASGGDITGLKTKHKDGKRKLPEVEDNTNNEEQSCDTSRLSMGLDSTEISQVKKKKAKKHKYEEQEDAESCVDTQKDSGLVSKKAKKKRKQAETNEQDADATFKQSNGDLEHSGNPGGLSYSSQSKKTSEPLQTTCSVVASDSIVKKKKKKQRTQKEESILDVKNDQFVETVQHNESQTLMLSSKKTKKNKKTTREEENDETTNKTFKQNLELRLNESVQPENTQTEEEPGRCSSPNVTILKSVKKKKKKKRVESDQHDTCTVIFEERASEIGLNDAKHKKKRKQCSDLSSPVALFEETPERRKKTNKRHSNGFIEESSELHTDHKVSGNSQSLMSTPSEIRSKKTKKKKNKEIDEADKSPVLLENGQTEETDSVMQENDAEKQVTGNSGVKIKKRRKDVEFTDDNIEMISESQVSQSDSPKKLRKKWQNTRCDDDVTSVETISQSHKIKDRKKKCKTKGDSEIVSMTEEHLESQADDVPPSKKKKRKSKVENVSILDSQNFSIHSEAEIVEPQNNDALPKIKKKKKKIKVNENQNDM